MPKKTPTKKSITKKMTAKKPSTKIAPKPMVTKTMTPQSAPKTQLNSTTLFLGVIALIIILFLGMKVAKTKKSHDRPYNAPEKHQQMQQGKRVPFDFADEKLTINSQVLQFSSGAYSDSSTPSHTAMIMNKTMSPDGLKSAAIVNDNPGGSGSFYYVTGASLVDGREHYAAPVLLGDRVKINAITVDDNGEIVVEYLDRPLNAPMSAEPIQPITAKFAFQENGELISVLN